MRKILSILFLLATAVSLGGCWDDPDAPYLQIAGGGFIFNYRIGEAFYGFVAKPLRDIPEGSVIIAEFEDPAGGPPIEVRQKIRDGMVQYTLRTPGVKGIVKDRPYKVGIRLIAPGVKTPLVNIQKQYMSNINQSDLPDKALTIGPGYHPNPELYDPKTKSFIIPEPNKS